MLIKFDENAYIDIDSIIAVVGDYSNQDPQQWVTFVMVNGGHMEVKGHSGKNISDAYMWKNGYMITDMMPESKLYKKAIVQPK